ncbi:gamma-glutamylaminecyclotransferase [Nephila pilipes]|uniref:Gamma-glutamylaminecyclotransferase n=1 Tax=Nephila pilipes TaxID=299642 RepID=A0A8X6QFB7_NEPPI|nr:gamma-glutamylaminecyclotransferase [Nephila pilipes]
MKLSVFCASLCRKYSFASHTWKCRQLVSWATQNFVHVQHLNKSLAVVVNASAPCALFHSSASFCAKSFQERENEHAHNVMSNISSYTNSIVRNTVTLHNGPLGTNSTEISSLQELNKFAEVTHQALLHDLSLEEEQFTEVIRCLVQKLPNVSDEQLIQILHFLCLWKPSPKSFSANFKLIWNTLDNECVLRFKNWDGDRKLLVSDYWFCLRLNRISQYNRSLIFDMLENLNLLSNSQVVQLMFYINLQRKLPQIQMENLEQRLKTVINSVSIEEIGIVCLGFFKTENRLTDFNTIQLIIDRFCRDLGKINNVTTVSVLKFLKKSLHLSHVNAYLPLLHRCVSHIPKWDILASVHLALLATECHIYHPLLLNTVTEKFATDIDNARIKDCTKLLQCLSHFNYFPASKFHELFFKEIFKEPRQTEIEIHPRILPYSALYYAYLGHYNFDLLHKVLDSKFRNYCYCKCPDATNSFAEIDYCVSIECKDYTGPRLSGEELKILKNRRGNLPTDSRNNNFFTRLVREITESLEDILNGKENILVRHILPHMYSPDVIVRLTDNSQSLSKLYSDYPLDAILIPPEDEIWACFVICPSFSFAFKSHHLTGNTKMKIRQLEKIGYKVIYCPFYDIPSSSSMRKNYIKEKLNILKILFGDIEFNQFMKAEGDSLCQYLVFVYGTLKKYEPNHDLVADPLKGKAFFDGMARTVQKYPLVIASRYNIPYLLYRAGVGKHVVGELYRIDEAMLAVMDELECNGKYYHRIQIEVQPFGPEGIKGSPVKPWVYFLLNFREHLLELPHLEDYSSKGPHGLEYVSSEETSDPEQIYE